MWSQLLVGPKKKHFFFFSQAIKIYILIKKLCVQHPWPVGENWTRMALIAHRSFL